MLINEPSSEEGLREVFEIRRHLNVDKAYSITDLIPESVYGSYVNIGTTSDNNYGAFLGFTFYILDTTAIKKFDSILFLSDTNSNYIELVNKKEKHLIERWGGEIDFESKNIFKIDTLIFDEIMPVSDYSNDIFYKYLKSKYSSRDLKYFDGNDSYSDSCSFVEVFNDNIVYESSVCGEGGSSQYIYMPKISNEKARYLMDELFDLDTNSSSDTNVYYEGNIWVSDTVNEPKGTGVGCYYEIEQTPNMTIIKNTYCGC